MEITLSEILHGSVLDIFRANLHKWRSVTPCTASDVLGIYGYVELEFPDVYRAAAWVKIWADSAGGHPPVSLRSCEPDLQFDSPVIVCVDVRGRRMPS